MRDERRAEIVRRSAMPFSCGFGAPDARTHVHQVGLVVDHDRRRGPRRVGSGRGEPCPTALTCVPVGALRDGGCPADAYSVPMVSDSSAASFVLDDITGHGCPAAAAFLETSRPSAGRRHRGSLPATIPFDSIPISLAGFRLKTITTVLPTSDSGLVALRRCRRRACAARCRRPPVSLSSFFDFGTRLARSAPWRRAAPPS